MAWVGCGLYLLLLTRISVPLLQSTTALGAARGWHGIMTLPPRAAGIRRLTGFSLKSGASAGGKGEHPTVIHGTITVPVVKTSLGHVLSTLGTLRGQSTSDSAPLLKYSQNQSLPITPLPPCCSKPPSLWLDY